MTKRDKQASEYANEERRVGAPCPHVRGTVTQHCSLNFTLTDEEREAIEWFAEVLKPLTRLAQVHNREKYKDTLRKLLERLK